MCSWKIIQKQEIKVNSRTGKRPGAGYLGEYSLFYSGGASDNSRSAAVKRYGLRRSGREET